MVDFFLTREISCSVSEVYWAEPNDEIEPNKRIG
jgi:hypothetical protein